MIDLDKWAMDTAVELAGSDLRASEIYPALVRCKSYGGSEDAIKHVTGMVCELARTLGKSFNEALFFIEEGPS